MRPISFGLIGLHRMSVFVTWMRFYLCHIGRVSRVPCVQVHGFSKFSTRTVAYSHGAPVGRDIVPQKEGKKGPNSDQWPEKCGTTGREFVRWRIEFSVGNPQSGDLVQFWCTSEAKFLRRVLLSWDRFVSKIKGDTRLYKGGTKRTDDERTDRTLMNI